MKLFQYAVLWHPTEKQEEDGKKSKVIVELATILAKDQNSAALVAARSIPDVYVGELEQVEVVIRPF